MRTAATICRMVLISVFGLATVGCSEESVPHSTLAP